MAPITSAIRRQMTDEGARVTADRDEFLAVCDAVDSIHARKLRALDASTSRVDELCAENEKLRGVCRRFAEYVSQDRCDGCVCKRRCDNGEIDECWQRTEIREIARELGIEVDE